MARHESWKFDDEPDFAALAALYTLDDGAPSERAGLEFNEYRVVVDGITLRFKETATVFSSP